MEGFGQGAVCGDLAVELGEGLVVYGVGVEELKGGLLGGGGWLETQPPQQRIITLRIILAAIASRHGPNIHRTLLQNIKLLPSLQPINPPNPNNTNPNLNPIIQIFLISDQYFSGTFFAGGE